jgi:hypothetical protein
MRAVNECSHDQEVKKQLYYSHRADCSTNIISLFQDKKKAGKGTLSACYCPAHKGQYHPAFVVEGL